MDFDALTRHWDRFGATDPLWAILTDPTRKGNRWDVAEFFETGRAEIADVVVRARHRGLPHRSARALDFGCGVGRLTQALAQHFAHVDGVDVAPSMIGAARRFNRQGARCEYHVNSAPSLQRWPDAHFDLIYTSRVLQHMEPIYAISYVRELLRTLAPGGYLSFDLPSERGFFPTDAAPGATAPADAYRANVAIADPPVSASAGDELTVTVEITNLSTHTWTTDEEHPLNVGNHWFRPVDGYTMRDDRRAPVPLPWLPGQPLRVMLPVTVPHEHGRYLLQCDVVHEGRTWFGDVGSPLAQTEITVGHALPPSSADAGETPAEAEPVMEMHAVPRSTIEALLHEGGATLLDVSRVYHCGPAWLAFRYDITR